MAVGERHWKMCFMSVRYDINENYPRLYSFSYSGFYFFFSLGFLLTVDQVN